MTFHRHTERQKPAAPAKVMPFPGRAPEQLVGYGFRNWLAGFDTGDIASWEEAWNSYCNAVGPEQAKVLLKELSHFVRAVKANACRDIELYSAESRGFCRDECLAISIIAACQHDARLELRNCAVALTGTGDIGDTLAGAQNFAAALKSANQILSSCSICRANCPLAKRLT